MYSTYPGGKGSTVLLAGCCLTASPDTFEDSLGLPASATVLFLRFEDARSVGATVSVPAEILGAVVEVLLSEVLVASATEGGSIVVVVQSAAVEDTSTESINVSGAEQLSASIMDGSQLTEK